MKILVYGAGNIGSLYAALLDRVGHDVSILARGERLAEIRDHGLRLIATVDEKETVARPKTVAALGRHDSYDVVLVALPRNRIAEVLPILAANDATPSILFFGNNAAGQGIWSRPSVTIECCSAFQAPQPYRPAVPMPFVMSSLRHASSRRPLVSSTVAVRVASSSSQALCRLPGFRSRSARTWTRGSRPMSPRSAQPLSLSIWQVRIRRDWRAHAMRSC